VVVVGIKPRALSMPGKLSHWAASSAL
jgi:hypothetical protein